MKQSQPNDFENSHCQSHFYQTSIVGQMSIDALCKLKHGHLKTMGNYGEEQIYFTGYYD